MTSDQSITDWRPLAMISCDDATIFCVDFYPDDLLSQSQAALLVSELQQMALEAASHSDSSVHAFACLTF